MKSGIMIIGPSGCGKTTLGRKVAEMLGYIRPEDHMYLPADERIAIW